MSDIELAARADANYFHSWRVLAGNAVRGEVMEREGLLLVSSALPVAWLNLALVMRQLADPGAAIAEAAAFFDERKLPFIVRVRGASIPPPSGPAKLTACRSATSYPGSYRRPSLSHPHRLLARRSARLRTMRICETIAGHVGVIRLSHRDNRPPSAHS